MTYKTSADGEHQIERREGRELRAYKDQKGIVTIGCGHTGRMSPPTPKMGDVITDAQCDEYLARDLAPLEAALNKALKVPVTQHEWDAMSSLGINIGQGGLVKSTVVKRVNVGDMAGAAEAFRMWEKPASLKGRREDEIRQFLTRDASTAPAVADRSAVLADRAAQAHTTAAATATVTAGAVAAGAAAAVVPAVHATVAHAAVAAHASPHHFFVALAAGAVAVISAGITAAVLISRHATSLAVGAAKAS